MHPALFDVHTHVQFYAFREDQDAVIKRALGAGVWMVNVGTQRDTSAKAVETAQKHPQGVYATVGLHPIHTEKSYHDPQELGTFQHSQEYENVVGEAQSTKGAGFTSRGEEFDYDYYKNLAQDPKVIAIGECGLDYYRIKNHESRIKQENTFRKQIELAIELKKPLMIHCRQAFADLISILNTKYKILNTSVIHFFTGTKEDARKLLDIGFSFSFGGVITFARDYDEAIKFIPLERILLETDAPYVTPAPYRGKRNEPAYVIKVARRLADIKNISLDKAAERTTKNARQIFGL